MSDASTSSTFRASRPAGEPPMVDLAVRQSTRDEQLAWNEAHT